ncbi:MAG TPA: YicC/YloC family endoribonuclease [Rhizomicrobium sp.]|nr:YicC/YloC family endoribonuclease [Rhizomicrobium sp.]
MALVSMTGFAEAQGAYETMRWRWEAKSVNGRGLDLRLRTPPGFESVEMAARPLAAERFKRGTIQCTLSVDSGENARGLKIDAVALAAAVKIAREVSAETGLPPARVDGLMALKGVIVQDDSQSASAPERAARDAAILETLATAFDTLAKARASEGNKLSNVLNTVLNEISDLVTTAGKLAATQPAALRDRLTAQLNDLLAPGTLSEERLAQEVALLAARADVREELDRLGAHVHEARALLKSGEAVGRKLDFLAQEFNREANTLCSKSADIELTRTGLALKAAIDQFREQSQNVE